MSPAEHQDAQDFLSDPADKHGSIELSKPIGSAFNHTNCCILGNLFTVP